MVKKSARKSPKSFSHNPKSHIKAPSEIDFIWKINRRGANNESKGTLVAHWEVSLDSISDNYTPETMDAPELFNQWIIKVHEKYPNNLIPIYWFVHCKEQDKSESMPFQFNERPNIPTEDFLNFFTWPINSSTGERLNWLSLTVVDKLWNAQRADRGGFIQQATGWKPSILQPYVYLPALMNTLLSDVSFLW